MKTRMYFESFFLAGLVLCLSLIAYYVQSASGYRVNTGSSSTINEWGTCRVITNNSGNNLFIPTNTSGEWNAFLAHMPAGVGASSCYTCDQNVGYAMHCDNWSWPGYPVPRASSNDCAATAASAGANAMEWYQSNGDCYAEWGTGCYVYPYGGWTSGLCHY